MIQPTYVTFEQAKKLKEKRFDVNVESCNYGHSKNENWIYKVHPEFPGWKGRIREAYFENEEPLLKPEQWQVVEWLRVVHSIWINVTMEKNEKDFISFGCGILRNENNEIYFKKRLSDFNSPTEAYEAAIEYTIKNLIP